MNRRSESSATLNHRTRGLVLVVGGTAFGLGAGTLGVFGLLTMLFGGLGRNDWGAAPVWLLLMAVGGLLGGIIGPVIAWAWFRQTSEKTYSLVEWLGLTLGIVVGVLFVPVVFSRYYEFFQIVLMLALVPLTAGGARLIAGLIHDALEPAPHANSTQRTK